MTISQKDWNNYISKMRKLSETAANKFQEYVDRNGFEDRKSLIDYAYAIVTKYGEGEAYIAAQMYDEIAELSGVVVESAVPAETATYGEIAKAINGSLKQSVNGKLLNQVAYRLTKQAGADTSLQNAIRDKAEWAWVPMGDTCAFCITLASRGWQTTSRKMLKGTHAEHIHANCDCQFAVRFDKKSGVKGYDPDKYRRMYNDAEGKNSNEKLRSLRRTIEERERINNHVVKYGSEAIKVDLDYIKTQEYRMKFIGLSDSTNVDDKICYYSRKILKDRDGTELETLILLDKKTGSLLGTIEKSENKSKIVYDKEIDEIIIKAKEKGKEIIAIHNHPHGYPTTADDCESAGIRGYVVGVSIGHNGMVYAYKPSNKGWKLEDCNRFHNSISLQTYYAKTEEEVIDIWIEMMNSAGFDVEKKEAIK